MPFPTSKTATAPQMQAAPTSPAAPAPPVTQAAPMPPAVPVAARSFWVAVNGQSVLKPEAECLQLPPATPAMTQDQSSGWSTIAALMGTPAAAPAGTRSAFARPGAAAAAVTAPVAGGMPKGLFAGVENAEITRKGNNMNEGDYVAKICSAEYKPGRSANFVIIEAEIITSSYDANDPAKQSCNREGSRATIFIKQNDSFAGNIKEIMLAVSGFGPDGKSRDVHDTVTQDECASLVAKEQPFTGAMVYLEARNIKTKAGGDFTRISWWPCPVNADGTPDTDKLFSEVR